MEIPWLAAPAVLTRRRRRPCASHGLASSAGSGIDRPRAVLELAGEAVAQALEAVELCIAQVEIREQPPQRDAGGAQPRIFDAAQPAHEPGEPATRDAVGQQEIEFLLLGNSDDQRTCGHLSVIRLQSMAFGEPLVLGSYVLKSILVYAVAAVAAAALASQDLVDALQLSRAKHRSLAGHSRMARRFAAAVPFYEYGETQFFRVDGAPDESSRRRAAQDSCACRRFRRAVPRDSASLPARWPARLRPAIHFAVPRAVSVQPVRARTPQVGLVPRNPRPASR